MVLIVVVGVLINQARDEGDDQNATDSSEYELVIGDNDAEHTVVIYEDFLCPICQALEAGTREQFAKLADEGQVQVRYRPFNLFSEDVDPRKPYSVAAGEVFGVVLETSGDDVAKKFHDLLFENQPSESGPFPDQDDLVQLAVEAGADRGRRHGRLWRTATARTGSRAPRPTPTSWGSTAPRRSTSTASSSRTTRTWTTSSTNLVAAVS